jgi:hypothetical protein
LRDALERGVDGEAVETEGGAADVVEGDKFVLCGSGHDGDRIMQFLRAAREG